MQRKHLGKRGSRYIYRCRVPFDLRHYFPSPTIRKNLHTSEKKSALTLLAALEYSTQRLFLQLRSGMLTKQIEKRLVAEFLQQGLEDLEGIAIGETTGLTKAIEMISLDVSRAAGDTPEQARELFSEVPKAGVDWAKRMLQERDTTFAEPMMDVLAPYLKENYNVTLSAADKKALYLQVVNAAKQLDEAWIALDRGEWSPMEQIREKVARDLAAPFYGLNTVLKKYQEHYLSARPNVKQGSKDDMAVECRTLLEIFGNVSIHDFNTMESVTKLKKILLRFPLNKRQRFGDEPIHSILQQRQYYQVINPKTANNYIDRAKQVVDFAVKSKVLNSANVYQGERFPTEKAAEEQRPAYDNEDVKRLITAICTQPLWTKSPPHPERFWLILIALFHGFRLGNIVALTKADICQTDRGTWIFRLTTGKTKATVRPVAICDSLLLLGFLDWVEKLPRQRLFQDSSASFSVWYNRNEIQKNGKPSLGFEPKHVTTEKGKCLYSLRHSFAGNVFDVTEDFKITSDMMGHSTGRSVTARYTKRTKAETLKEITEKMQLEHIDLDMLEARAIDLFFRS